MAREAVVPAVLRQLRERCQREGGARSDLEQVLDWLLQVEEDTFNKWQRRGSDTLRCRTV